MIRALAIALVLALAALAWQSSRLHSAQIAMAGMERDAAIALAAAEHRASETNNQAIGVIFDAGTAYQRGLTHAQTTADRVADDLRSGTLRLRREWAACETGRLADSAAAGRELAEADERRIALASAVVRVGADSDAKERALIAAYEGVRAAVNGAPGR